MIRRSPRRAVREVPSEYTSPPIRRKAIIVGARELTMYSEFPPSKRYTPVPCCDRIPAAGLRNGPRTADSRRDGVFTPLPLQQVLDDKSDALSAANTHSHQPEASVRAHKFVHRLDCQDGTSRSERVAEGDCTTVRIDLCGVEG